MTAPAPCAICVRRGTLLAALNALERRYLIARANEGLHLTTQMNELHETRALITSHKHHAEAASA